MTHSTASRVSRSIPGKSERNGRHAMTVVGYDDRKQAIKVINSYGTAWGDGGFGWIAYDTFLRDAKEAYTMRVYGKPHAPKQKPVVASPEPKEPKPPVAAPEVAVVPVPGPPKPERVPVLPKPAPVPEVTVSPEPVPPKPAPASVPDVTVTSDIVPPKPAPTTKVVEPVPPVQPIKRPVVDADCSRVTSLRQSNQTVISGFVGSTEALAALRARYHEPQYRMDVQLRPWPQCEVLLTLDKVLRSDDQPQLTTNSGQTQVQEGRSGFIRGQNTKKASLHLHQLHSGGRHRHQLEAATGNWPLSVSHQTSIWRWP